ncbi:unnamed protein product [Urochloa humidicola]
MEIGRNSPGPLLRPPNFGETAPPPNPRRQPLISPLPPPAPSRRRRRRRRRRLPFPLAVAASPTPPPPSRRHRFPHPATSLSSSPPPPPSDPSLAVAASPKSSTRAGQEPLGDLAVALQPRPAAPATTNKERPSPRQRRSTHHDGVPGEHRIDPVASKEQCRMDDSFFDLNAVPEDAAGGEFMNLP